MEQSGISSIGGHILANTSSQIDEGVDWVPNFDCLIHTMASVMRLKTMFA